VYEGWLSVSRGSERHHGVLLARDYVYFVRLLDYAVSEEISYTILREEE